VTRIFVSHFHGDHCLGLGSMLMRLNLDKVTHPIHCYYPASGKNYFDRLRFGSIYHEHIQVVEHPVAKPGLVEDGDVFRIEAFRLDHGTDNFAWRIKEKDTRRFDAQKLKAYGVEGPFVRTLESEGKITIGGKEVALDDVSAVREGDVFSIVIDTLPCRGAEDAARGAKLLLCESTYLEEHRDLAERYMHMTARQAAELAKKAGAGELVLTHFSARYQNLEGFAKEARAVFPNTHVADDLKVFPFKK
jgi:ribonuclease Z